MGVMRHAYQTIRRLRRLSDQRRLEYLFAFRFTNVWDELYCQSA